MKSARAKLYVALGVLAAVVAACIVAACVFLRQPTVYVRAAAATHDDAFGTDHASAAELVDDDGDGAVTVSSAGSYCLSADLKTVTIDAEGEVSICLNDHTIASDDGVDIVVKNGTVSLFDCAEYGQRCVGASADGIMPLSIEWDYDPSAPYVYNGKEQMPKAAEVTFDNGISISGQEIIYTAEGANATADGKAVAAGDYTVTASAPAGSNYSFGAFGSSGMPDFESEGDTPGASADAGAAACQFTINKANIADIQEEYSVFGIDASEGGYVYTGEAIEPGFSVVIPDNTDENGALLGAFGIVAQNGDNYDVK